MSSTLQCTIRPKEGGEIQRTAEISGEGKSYLACLSENLSAMQVEVNSLLTEMVEKEKAESSSKNSTRSEGDSGSEDMDDDDGDSEKPDCKRPKPS